MCFNGEKGVNMTYDIEGGIRYARAANNAFWYNVHLDTKCPMNGSKIEYAVAHLNDCRENPTIGLLAGKKYTTSVHPEHFQTNLMDLYSYEKVRKADKAFRSRFENLYPHTGKIRKFLIDTKSVVLDYVKPIKKTPERFIFSFLNKLR